MAAAPVDHRPFVQDPGKNNRMVSLLLWFSSTKSYDRYTNRLQTMMFAVPVESLNGIVSKDVRRPLCIRYVN